MRGFKAFIDAFERMTLASYARNFVKSDGEKFTVDAKVNMRGADKIVETKLAGADGTVVPFNYRLHETGGIWKIIDVYLDGYASQLEVRRADFASTIASSGLAGLIRKLNELVAKQMAAG